MVLEVMDKAKRLGTSLDNVFCEKRLFVATAFIFFSLVCCKASSNTVSQLIYASTHALLVLNP